MVGPAHEAADDPPTGPRISRAGNDSVRRVTTISPTGTRFFVTLGAAGPTRASETLENHK